MIDFDLKHVSQNRLRHLGLCAVAPRSASLFNLFNVTRVRCKFIPNSLFSFE